VSTGNLKERTARFYGDHCLLTANRAIMADVNRIFNYLEQPKLRLAQLKQCKTLWVCPLNLRKEVERNIDREIKLAREKKPAGIIVKLNSLSDEALIEKLYEAARAGVEIQMIVRGIFCAYTENKKYKKPFRAISIVDEYLEHSRVIVFHNGGKEKVYISSADWMVRNLDHRVELGCPILDDQIRQELIDVLKIQLSDNVKARVLDNELSNAYVHTPGEKIRSQIEIQHYLENKTKVSIETGGDRHRK
jgi:polyphosphate kinase